MAKKDYYAILGIDKKSSPEEIKKAYREKAKEHHPDRNIGDALSVSKFQEIQEAFDILSDPKKRSIYDMSGVSGMKFNQQGNWRETSFSEDSFNEFSSFFNKSKFKGRTVFYKLEVSLEDCFYGCSKTISLEKNKICENCQGSGSTELEDCGFCYGTGVISQKQGNFVVNLECGKCNGQGKTSKVSCSLCMGKGTFSKEIKEFTINLPKGVSAGYQIVLHKEGEPSKHKGGMAGDLIVNVAVAEHPYFKRDNLNLNLEVPLSYGQLINGGDISVPFFGKQTLMVKIPPSHENNTSKLKLAGMGFTLPNGAVGDYVISIRCDIPRKINDEYKNLINQLFEHEKKHPSERIMNWNKKVFS